jgi:Trp operon repressor
MSLFLHATTNQNLEHRRAALWELRKLDEERFVGILVDNLNAISPTPKEPYWKSREAALANLVMETDDARVWKVLLAAARRADVGLRMELMNPMCYTYIGQRQRKQRLEFVAAFLDDATVRDDKSNPALFDGPYAAFTFPKIEVRNFAAMQIACILHLPEEPKPEWTSKQWTALREKVRANMRREQNGG